MEKIEFVDANPCPAEYNAIRSRVGWSGYTDEQAAIGLGATLYSVCVRRDGCLVGMGRVIGDGIMVFYIQDIIVDPEYQGQGIGKGIMERVMVFIRSRAVNNSIIGLMSAVGKEDFYRKFGFIARPNEKMGSGMTQFYRGDEA